MVLLHHILPVSYYTNVPFPPGLEKRVEAIDYCSTMRSGASHPMGCMV